MTDHDNLRTPEDDESSALHHAEVTERRRQEDETLKLSARDSALFARALLNPPAPNAALRTAAETRELWELIKAGDVGAIQNKMLKQGGYHEWLDSLKAKKDA